ncbi:hypothetical protein LPB90_18330 [Chryseobacterium sp. LC2016-29]|uniref:hypothetical protein n=1 Tax=Chryseobacterium sp. LC2016-29 TaxID=2897331 RepID=UPI001E43CE7E|nr:hypothetical protein [Chryseobacterium sp. LC2016-29]MCD0480400.1 hypothetical protein [Chryseobacterium sp. LC2016-29]
MENIKQKYKETISLIESKYKYKYKKETFYFIGLIGWIFPALFIFFNEFLWGFQNGEILGVLIYSPFFYFWFFGLKAEKEEKIIQQKLKELNF